MIIFHSYSILKIAKPLTLFAQIPIKNYHVFAKISESDDMVLGNYDVVIFCIIFSPSTNTLNDDWEINLKKIMK